MAARSRMGAREEETVSDHDHHHAGDLPGPHGSPLTETQLRVKALESLLVDKGLVDPAVLGLPPVWYKSAPYRSRAVLDPRGVLREFGLELPEEVEVRVWDSTAELRYLVLPERPAGTEGMSEEGLAALVTRDAMIGVAKVQAQRGDAGR